MSKEVFDAKLEEKNGKKILIVKANSKEVVHDDGRKDVVVTVPTLDLINKAINLQE